MAPELPPLDPALWNEDKGPTIIAATCAVMAVSTLFVVARIFFKAIMMRQMNLDDYLIIFSLAVVCLLCRLLSPGIIHRRILWGSTTSSVVIMMACVAILFAQCTPSRSQWDFSVKEGVLLEPLDIGQFCQGRMLSVHAPPIDQPKRTTPSFSAFLDLYLAVYPATVLWQLHLKPKKKAALCAALGIGSIATVGAIYKTITLSSLAHYDFTCKGFHHHYARSLITNYLRVYQRSYHLNGWSMSAKQRARDRIEGSTIIIASCIPLLQPLLELILGRRAFGWSTGRKKYERYSSDPNHKQSGGGGGGGGSSHEMSLQTRHRHARRKFDMESVLATQIDENRSQERILASDQPASLKPISEAASETTGASGVVPQQQQSDAERDRDRKQLGGIVRTDEVSISYNRDPSFGDGRNGNQTMWN
ncbi:hypothetical protein PG994_015066 [Apiospora phragmitis]|uniref:Rhodopsin domain-containing protein n=1 Tax=Apiospora phragmitis TaxID=2905665 RepID=A0ABR1SX38_9PEZI